VRTTVVNALRAGAVAAVVSGVPSTAWALASGRDPLEASVAAGSILLPQEERRDRLFVAAIPVHLALSVGWGVALAAVLPRQRTALAGAVAGLAIAAIDLGLVGRHFSKVAALPVWPQLADHVAFGATVGWMLRGRGG